MDTDREVGAVTVTRVHTKRNYHRYTGTDRGRSSHWYIAWVQTERQEQLLVHGYRQRDRNSHWYMGTDRETGVVTGTWVQTERQEQSLVHGYRQRGRSSHWYMSTDREAGKVTGTWVQTER